MVVFFFSSPATLTKAQDSSTSCASKLIPCQPYLATTTQPPGSCCNSIKEAVSKELPCLCKIYNDPTLFKSLGLNVSQAIMLSQRCGVTTDLSNCSGIVDSDFLLVWFMFFFRGWLMVLSLLRFKKLQFDLKLLFVSHKQKTENSRYWFSSFSL